MILLSSTWTMSDMYVYPTPSTQYCVVGSSQKNVEKKWSKSKTTFKSKIISVFEVRITFLFHATKCAWAEQFSTWRKCCLFVCEKFRTHNVRFRNSLYFFIFRDSCNASSKYAWAKQSEISFLCDSRDARFRTVKVSFQQWFSVKKLLLSRKYDALKV